MMMQAFVFSRSATWCSRKKERREERAESSLDPAPPLVLARVFSRVVAHTCIEVEARLAFLCSFNAQGTFRPKKKSAIRSGAAASMRKRKMKNHGREDRRTRSVKLN